MRLATTTINCPSRHSTPLGSFFSVLLLLLSLILVIPAQGQTSSEQIFPNRPAGFVNDFANVLSRSNQNRLERKLRTYRDTTSTEIAIVTLKSLQGKPVEEVSLDILNTWNIGQADVQNGAVILVSVNDQKIRIEVGYGLEGALTDVMSGRIIDQILAPSFREGDFYGGLSRATSAIFSLLGGEYDAVKKQSASTDNANYFPYLLLLGVILYFFVLRRDNYDHDDWDDDGKGGRRKRRRTLGSGGIIFLPGGGLGSGGSSGGFGGGGGFGGFSGGGGGFMGGGGGASGGW